MAIGLRFRPSVVTSGSLALNESSHGQNRCSKQLDSQQCCSKSLGPDCGLSGRTSSNVEHPSPPTIWMQPPRLPLSDHRLDLCVVNLLLSSAQSREKCLKVFQYIMKLLAYIFVHAGSVLGLTGMSAKSCADRASKAAKLTSQARRFFKFFRWLKHFEDAAAVRKEGSFSMRVLLMLSISCNVVADIFEDVCSLERLGFIAAGSLPVWAELDANRCQLLLAVIEIAFSAARLQRLRAESASKHESGEQASLGMRRTLTMASLELSKFVADLGKAFWDCECSFASELVFIVCGLWAGLVSTHKYALKALK